MLRGIDSKANEVATEMTLFPHILFSKAGYTTSNLCKCFHSWLILQLMTFCEGQEVQKEVDVFIWAETYISRRWSSISDCCQWQGSISAPHHYWRKVFSVCFFFPGCSATTESFTSVNAANILFWVILIFSLVKSWFVITFLQMAIIKLCTVVYISGVGSRLKLQ